MRRFLLAIGALVLMLSTSLAKETVTTPVKEVKPKPESKPEVAPKITPDKTAGKTATTFEAEVIPQIILDKVEDGGEEDDRFDELDRFSEMHSRKGPMPQIIGEPIKWVVRNMDKWRGWSLTGYSWGGLTKDFKPWRFKLGIVNGEWEAERQQYITEADWAHFAEWERQIDTTLVIGFSVTIIF